MTQPHIKNPELYYNEVVEKKQARKRNLELRRLKNNYEGIDLATPRPITKVLDDLVNFTNNQRGTSRLLLNVMELEKHHSDKLTDDIKEIIVGALRSIGQR